MLRLCRQIGISETCGMFAFLIGSVICPPLRITAVTVTNCSTNLLRIPDMENQVPPKVYADGLPLRATGPCLRHSEFAKIGWAYHRDDQIVT